METVTYYLALICVVSIPPAIGYWYLIHPFAAAWRRRGPWVTYLVVTPPCLLAAYGIWLLREPLLRVRFGFQPWLTGIGAVLYLGSIVLEILRRKHLTTAMLVGLPEVSAARAPGKLLTEGIYGRIRHPRYVSYMLGMAGIALFVNYLGVYLLLVVSLPMFYLLVVLEERELRERFGKQHEEYCREVPAFFPRLKS